MMTSHVSSALWTLQRSTIMSLINKIPKKKLHEFIHEKKGMFPLKCEVKVPNKRIGLACLFRLLKFIKGNGVYLSLMGCTG